MFSICRHSRTGPGSCLTGKFEFHLAVAPDEMEGLINIYLQNYTIQTNLAPTKIKKSWLQREPKWNF